MTLTVAVTGASGFLGSALIKHLRAAGAPVDAWTRRGTEGAFKVEDYPEIEPRGPTVLVHLAETRDPARAASDGMTHVAQTVALCQALLDKPWAHVVYVSSAVVYGDAVCRPRRTDETPAPMGPYGEAKLACEQLVLARGGTVVRPSNLYGPRMAPGSVLGDLLRQLPGGAPIQLRDPAPVRDFIWIDDAAAGLAAAAARRTGGVLNLGTGRGAAIDDLVRLALAHAGAPDRAVHYTRPGDRPSHLVLDMAETTRLLGWSPAVSIETGLATLIDGLT